MACASAPATCPRAARSSKPEPPGFIPQSPSLTRPGFFIRGIEGSPAPPGPVQGVADRHPRFRSHAPRSAPIRHRASRPTWRQRRSTPQGNRHTVMPDYLWTRGAAPPPLDPQLGSPTFGPAARVPHRQACWPERRTQGKRASCALPPEHDSGSSAEWHCAGASNRNSHPGHKDTARNELRVRLKGLL